MSDRFRFRAWDIALQGYRNDFIYSDEFDESSIEGLSSFFEYLGRAQMDYGCEFKLVQCTGLHDKKGKPIFEGDVLELSSIWGESIHVVKGPSKSYPAFDLEPSLDSSANSLSELECSGMYVAEIIGSIYTHPHLLGAQHD